MAISPGTFLRKVALDPGVVFSVADCLMFAATNPVGLAACATATAVSATLKTVSLVRPKFLEKYPRIMKVADNEETPLRSSGYALMAVGLASAGSGLLLPATASLLFAVGNFRLAKSLARAKEDNAERQRKKSLPPADFGELLLRAPKVTVKSPDLYLNAGFAFAGLMAGGPSLWVLPIVASAFGIGMNNVLRHRPEHEGHPKLITSAAGFVFSAIGFTSGHGLVAAAHALNAAVIADAEGRVTPGGYRQILKDVTGVLPFVGKAVAKAVDAPTPAAPPPPAPEKAPALPQKKGLARLFRRANDNTPAAPAPRQQTPAPRRGNDCT